MVLVATHARETLFRFFSKHGNLPDELKVLSRYSSQTLTRVLSSIATGIVLISQEFWEFISWFSKTDRFCAIATIMKRNLRIFESNEP